MHRLNLGCGYDLRYGYENVDLNDKKSNIGYQFSNIDLSKFPWPWNDCEIDEILMLDIFEHFQYNITKTVLKETYRILKKNAFVDIQVPDFEHCANAALWRIPFDCFQCGHEFVSTANIDACPKCNVSRISIMDAAIHRLYGGQNYVGNWHYNAFTRFGLIEQLKSIGFSKITELEKYHQWANWNFKLRAFK